MSLIEHLQIRTPLVWVNTSEPSRYIEVALKYAPGDTYVMDPQKGFSIWDKEDQVWKAVLFENVNQLTGEPFESATHDLSQAISYVLDNPGTMIINFAHKYADAMADLWAWAFEDYRKAFYADDADLLGPQFLLFSYGADIPEDMTHLLTIVNPSLPTLEELAEIVAHIATNLELPEETDLSKVAAAGLGLSEPDFVQACLLNLRKTRTLDPQYINETKMARIRAMCDLEIIRPDKGLETIGGLDNAKKLIRHVQWLWQNEEAAAERGIEPMRRLLLVGVPGTGKSAICEAAAHEMGYDLAKAGISKALNSFIGKSEENMRNMFRQVGALAPIVMWVDEFGRDASQGNWQGDGGTTSRVHGEFLTGIQELPNNVLFIAAANQIGHIAPEMLRADRFDRIMFVGFPTEIERMEILRIHLKELADKVDIQSLAQGTSMFTGAEIKALIRETKFKVSLDDHDRIPTTEDIHAVASNTKNLMWLRYRPEVKAMYAQALSDWDWASSGQYDEAQAILKLNEDSLIAGRSTYAGF